MDHVCYLDGMDLKQLSVSEEILLRSRNRKGSKTHRIFKGDFVYLATRKRPRSVVFKTVVLDIEETKAGVEAEQQLPVCYVDRKRRTDRRVRLVKLLVLEQAEAALDSSDIFLRAYWEPVGDIANILQGGEMIENSKI